MLTDIIQWDTRNWGKAIPFWEPFLSSTSGKKAAAFGEREGGLSLWLATNGFEVECSDYDAPETIPFPLHIEHSIVEKINYSQQDITQINFEDNQFDIVIFKSVIGTLATKKRQQEALDELYRILKPGGYLLFAENLEATVLHRYARKRFTNWGNRWRYIQWKEKEEMLSKFTTSTVKSHGFLATFGRSEGQRNFLSRIDQIFAPVTPKSWKYILFAACRK
ncbi:MAG: class I SAM-dependent methyltransferase [Crocinitomicaceae bacterium]|nr:class I SAM-dependent methyltransferase [Crocinitomicaceae bacterium]